MDKINIILIFIVIYIYATLRYIVFGTTPWEQIPLFVTNKALSFSGLILLILSQIIKYFNKNNNNNNYFIIGFIFICLHSVISIILLNKVNYAKFYHDSGAFKFDSGISMLAGILSFIMLLFNYIEKTGVSKIKSKFINFFILILPLLHLFFMGYKGWFTFSDWPGQMPPITLISFLLYSLGLIILYIKKVKYE